MAQRVFDETLPLPPAGFEFGFGRARAPLPPGQLGKQPLLQAAATASFTDFDVFLDISKGIIVPKGCKITTFCSQGCGMPPDRSLLNFEPIPNVSPKSQSFHAFCDANDCGDPTYFIDGYASLKIDLSQAPFAGNQVMLVSLFAYSFQARVPIGAPPDGDMNLIVWGPSGVGSDWLRGSGSLFAASVLPSANETLTPNSFSLNLDLSGLSAFYLETALNTIESFPDNQDAYINPETLRLRVFELLDVIVQTDVGLLSGATVNIRDTTGTVVATGTTDAFGVFTVALAPGNYTAQSVLGSLSQTSALLSAVSQTVTFTWPIPRPVLTVTIIGETAYFDATKSTDPASTAANDTFAWSFGDGATQSGVGLETVSHTYVPGTYTAQLTQTSPDGLSSTISVTLTVVAFGGFGGGVGLRFPT